MTLNNKTTTQKHILMHFLHPKPPYLPFFKAKFIFKTKTTVNYLYYYCRSSSNVSHVFEIQNQRKIPFPVQKLLNEFHSINLKDLPNTQPLIREI